MARMLVCKTHKTVNVLPDYDTANDMEGKYDYELRESIDRHLSKFGSDPGKHASIIIRIEDDELDLIDPKRMEEALFNDQLESFIRNEREQLKLDALGCYNLHNRPAYGIGLGCQDYMSDSRAIGRTKGVAKADRNYLCSFCPYNSYVEHAKNKQIKFRGE